MEFSEIEVKIKKDTTHNFNEFSKKKYFEEVGYSDFCEEKFDCKKKIISICLTVYNEDEVDFISTFFSLIKSIKYATDNTAEKYQYHVCIIVDGMDSMHPLLFEWAAKYGLLDKAVEFQMHELSICKTQLMFDDYQLRDDDRSIRINFCISKNNKGKLNSHKWFFEYFCKKFSPEYVMQVDVGTKLELECIDRIVESFCDENVAGVAACPLPEKSSVSHDILSNWQYQDLLFERLIQWPIESSMDYVSVLPGQLHAFRWRSIYSKENSLLPIYFKDLSRLSIFEASMYLAEDRVLGIEVSYGEAHEESWKLTYKAEAKATIDMCGTWPELLKQRRRWVCGAFACKLKMFESIKNGLLNKGFSDPKKYLFSPLYQALIMVIELLQPSIVLLLYTSCFFLAKECFSGTNFFAEQGLNAAMVFSVAIFLGSVVACSTRYIEKIAKGYIDFCCWYQSIYLFLLIGIIAFNKVQYLWLLLSLIGLATLFGIKIIRNYNFYAEKEVIFHHIFARHFVSFIIQIYAVANVVDTSWGTKGKAKPINHEYIEALGKWRLKLKKYSTMAIYALLNIFAFLLILNAFSLEIIVYSVFSLQFFLIIWATLCFFNIFRKKYFCKLKAEDKISQI